MFGFPDWYILKTNFNCFNFSSIFRCSNDSSYKSYILKYSLSNVSRKVILFSINDLFALSDALSDGYFCLLSSNLCLILTIVFIFSNIFSITPTQNSNIL